LVAVVCTQVIIVSDETGMRHK